MTLINLRSVVFNDMGGTDPESVLVSVSPWQGSPLPVPLGDAVLMPNPISFVITKSDHTLELVPNLGKTWAYRITIRYEAGSYTRYVVVPDMATIDFRDLIDVDPASLDPVGSLNMWDIALSRIPESFHIVNGELWVTREDETSENLGTVVGPQGAPGATGSPGPRGPEGLPGPGGARGPAGQILSATATGLPEGAEPTVTLSGTAEQRSIAFGIPAGDTGPQGAQGDPGPQGVPGQDGASGTLPIGSYLEHSAPTLTDNNYSLADGGELSRTEYAAYFAQVGVLYGPGNGTTTFNKPNRNGRHSVGAHAGRALGAVNGALTMQLGVTHLAAHKHTVGASSSASVPGQSSLTIAGTNAADSSVTTVRGQVAGAVVNNLTGSGHTHTNPDTGFTGAGEAFSLESPNLAVWVYVKVR